MQFSALLNKLESSVSRKTATIHEKLYSLAQQTIPVCTLNYFRMLFLFKCNKVSIMCAAIWVM